MCWPTVRSLQIANSKDFYDLEVFEDQLGIKCINYLYNLVNIYFINFLQLVLRVQQSPHISFPRPLSCPCTSRALREPGKVEQAQKRRRVCVTAPEPGGLIAVCSQTEMDQTGQTDIPGPSLFCSQPLPTLMEWL